MTGPQARPRDTGTALAGGAGQGGFPAAVAAAVSDVTGFSYMDISTDGTTIIGCRKILHGVLSQSNSAVTSGFLRGATRPKHF